MKVENLIKVVLIGHDSRNANLGVGALTVSNIEAIRRVADQLGSKVQFTILIGRGSVPSYVPDSDVVERVMRPLRRPWDFFRVVRANDLAVDISGGDSFTDIYGKRRIFQVLLQKYIVHLARRPLIMAPQTVGPFIKPYWRWLAAVSIRRCIVVATRDDKSTALVKKLAKRCTPIEASDVALRLPYISQEISAKKKPPQVGLNVSRLLMQGGYNGKNMFKLKADYPSSIHSLIGKLQRHPDGCAIHLIGHVIPQRRGGVEDDYQACLDLAEKFPDVVVAPPFKTPSEAKNYISGLDFFVGARMHACIAAFSTNVPVAAMAYSRKFEGLFGSLGYDLTVDCTSKSTEEVVEFIMDAYTKRTSIADEMQECIQNGLTRLKHYDAALEEVLKREKLGERLDSVSALAP